nr:hypothetical protein L203_05971 [Cryptococcus depauperatus CBS 7841]
MIPSSKQTILDETSTGFDSSELSSVVSDEGVPNTKVLSKKRRREQESTTQKTLETFKKTKPNGDKLLKQSDTVTCHHLLNSSITEAFVFCTKLVSQGRKKRPCHHVFCDIDLIRKYELSPESIRMEANKGIEGHDADAPYVFACPCCKGQCLLAKCRRKYGLPPLKSRKSNTKSRDTSQPFGSAISTVLHDTSDLSDLDSNVKIKGPKGNIKMVRKKAVRKRPAENTATKKDVKTGKPIKRKSNKGKTKSKPKAEQTRDSERIPDGPIFARMSTKLGHEEATQRMALREFLWRFKQILYIPERSLSALDDFERPITESNVKLFAGGMLDLIRDELEVASTEEDIQDMLFNLREELRYYADLSRFASIFHALSEPLHLTFPPELPNLHSQTDNATLRELFGLDNTQVASAWSFELPGSSRRSASRTPQPSEIVRMLLALAVRTLSTPKIRGDMELFSDEINAKKQHAAETKRENLDWDKKKQELLNAKLLCKTAAQKKASTVNFAKQQREHDLRISQINVNMRAEMNHCSLRFESLGRDPDGRLYYTLGHQPVKEDSRAPTGWAMGLFTWGPAIAARASENDDLPYLFERWSHFSKSAEVRKLVKWVEWRYKNAVQEAKAASESKKSTEIPLSNVSPNIRKDDLSDSSSTSSLTPPPTTLKESLMSLVDPPDYKPSPDILEEQAVSLVGKLHEVVEWLDVLEWKG